MAGYNSTLFYTQSNIGLDAETKPPTAEISISRREGVLAPGFEGGETPPVVVGFHAQPSAFSRFFLGVQPTFAGGDAACALVQSPGILGRDGASDLCLSTKPTEPWWSAASIPEKGSVVPFAFGTDSVFGLKVAWTGTAGPFPDSLRLGFNRKDLAWAPLFGTDTPTDGTNCTVPGTNASGYIVWMPSFIATLNAKGQAGQSPTAGGDSNNQNGQSTYTGVNVEWVQYFATGTVATALANNNDIRSVLLTQAFPAAAGTFDPTAECVRAWVVSSPDHATALKQWWASQQLPGIPYQILDSRHSTERKTFIAKENITGCD